MNVFKKRKVPMGIVILCVGIALTAVGVWMKQDQDVWRKAVLMCLECIGLG